MKDDPKKTSWTQRATNAGWFPKSFQPAFAENDKPVIASESINRAELHFARFPLDR